MHSGSASLPQSAPALPSVAPLTRRSYDGRRMLKPLALLIALAIVACSSPPPEPEQDLDSPPTSTIEQSISACTNGDGAHIQCYPADRISSCSYSYNCNPSGYCPEATPTEIAYCASPHNCGRPEYGTYCKGYACPDGNADFPHWCLLGAAQ